mgnify:CR=1 FL=1
MSNNAKRVLFRKGTTADHQLFTGARGEVTVDVTRNIAIVHNGITTGGHELVGVAATGQSITNKDSIGIRTAVADSALTVEGDARVSGIVTANSLDAVNILVGILTGTNNNTISLSTSIIPNANETYDLGSLTNRFRDLYLSGNTLKLGDASLSASSDTLSLSGVGLGVSHLNSESINVTGISTFQSDLNIAGDLDVDGHADLDNVSVAGVSTFIGTTEVKNSSFKVTNSSTSDHYLQITQNANASLSLDKVGDGAFFIGGNNIYLKNDGNNEVYAGFEANGKSYLNYDGSTKIETTASGIDVNGHTELDNVNVSSATTTASLNVTGTSLFQGNVDLNDNVNLRIGTGNDLQLYHDTNNSYISNIVGNLYITDNGGSIFVQPQSGENSAVFNGNTGVELFYNGSKKFETTNIGATITGTVSATTFSGSGASLTDIPTSSLTGDIPTSSLTGTIPTSSLTGTIPTSSLTGTINADTSTEAYVTESDGDTVNRGLVFCDAANNASGNKDLKYDRNLTYNANSNTLYANKVQGTEVNISTISLGGSTGTNGQYIKSTGSGATWSAVDASTLGGDAKTSFMYRNANTDLTMNNQSLHFGAFNTNSKIRWSGTTTLWDLIAGDLKIRNNTTDRFTFARTTGNFTASGDVTAFSDITLKKNIELIPNALDKVLSLRGITYNRIDIENEPKQSGVIAQEVEKVLPEVVHTDEEGIKSVAYGNMVGLLIEAIKEQQQQIDELRRKLEEK